MKSVGKRIKEAREAAGFTQRELALKIGVTAGAIGNYESGTSHPKEPILIALMESLQVDANFLFRDEMSDRIMEKAFVGFGWADPIACAYAAANRQTREAACNVLRIPYVKPDEEPEPEVVPTYNFPAAAGLPIWVGDDEKEDREFPPGIVPKGTSFAIRIAGDSMEPSIPNKAYVFVKQQPDLRNGELGVFRLYDEAMCKRFYKDSKSIKLISDNPKYDARIIAKDDEGFGLVGKVIGHYLPEG